jgi:hypothetical protein
MLRRLWTVVNLIADTERHRNSLPIALILRHSCAEAINSDLIIRITHLIWIAVSDRGRLVDSYQLQLLGRL